jgi:hypothetical protein
MYFLFVFLFIEGISTLILMESNSPPFLLHGIKQKTNRLAAPGCRQPQQLKHCQADA